MIHLAARLASFTQNHLYLLLHMYDPILDLHPRGKGFRQCSRKFAQGNLPHIRRHFLVPAVYMRFFVLVGIIGLELDGRGYVAGDDFGSSAAALFESPYNFLHQFIPREAWPYTDLIILTASEGLASLYMFMAQSPMISERCRMFSRGDGPGVVSGFRRK